MNKKYFLTLLLFLFFSFVKGQEKAEMADTMRSNGRIYVVVTVILVILAGLFLYLFRLDRKISRMEKENK